MVVLPCTTVNFAISGISASSSPSIRLLPFTSLNLKPRASHAHPRLHFQIGSLKTHVALCTRTAAHSPSVTTAALASEAPTKVIAGQSRSIADHIEGEIAAEVSRMKEEIGAVPGLGLIIVGDRKESDDYFCLKMSGESVGIYSHEVRLPADSSEEELLKHIKIFNDDLSAHGILVQLPLPSHMNAKKVLDAVCIEKDVQGIHPFNIGCLAIRDREPWFVPCTPKGCLELLHRQGVAIKGKRAVVVIDRIDVVGTSVAQMLQREEATVTVVHSQTLNPEEFTIEADILIAAVGKPNMVRNSWIKPGAVVIDLGMNLVSESKGIRELRMPRVVGDVCYEEASKIIPIPEEIRPLTIAMILSNTLISAKRFHNFT